MYSGITVGISLYTRQKTHETDWIIVSHELRQLAHLLNIYHQSSFIILPYRRSIPVTYKHGAVKPHMQRISLRSQAKAETLKRQERKRQNIFEMSVTRNNAQASSHTSPAKVRNDLRFHQNHLHRNTHRRRTSIRH